MPDKSLRNENFDIAIVGGSIAGCTAAIELQRLGFNVVLFERTGDVLKDRGAGIGIPTSVLETFVERDLVDRSIPYFLVNAFSRIWKTADEADYGYLAWDQPTKLAALNWGVLYGNLRSRVADGIYRSGHLVTAIRPRTGNTVTIHLADKGTRDFDLVVCADGYASLGRQSLFPDTHIAYAGYVLWRGMLVERDLTESDPLEQGIKCLGYPGGHGIFYFVPGANESVAKGERLVNWGMYIPVAETELASFLTDSAGQQHEGSLPPGGMPSDRERSLKAAARSRLPSYYSDIVARSVQTFAYAIYDCEVPDYCENRICLIGDAGAFARPHTAAGALKGINDAVELGKALATDAAIDERLAQWNQERTTVNNNLVRFGKQLGRALVEEIPNWSTMDVPAMEAWFKSIVTIETDYLNNEATD